MALVTPSEYVVTARKWRPLRFEEVVGQDHVTTTLRNALASGRIHHAYLFCGPRGVGKTTTARIIARAVNCAAPRNGIEPCNQCDSCQDILNGRSLDVVEIDGASNNSVEDVRRIRENAKYPPAYGKFKVYIIDEVHMLSASAFNALLKTLEEPPPHLLFIFATTEPHKVPATIQSRCQRFDFHRMDTRTIASHLRRIAQAESVQIDDDALYTIARFADGSMRDAQSLFDQVRAFSTDTITGSTVRQSLHILGDDVYFAITDAILTRDLAAAFALSQQIISQGFDVHQTILGLLEHLRNALTVRVTGTTDLVDAADETRHQYRQLAQQLTEEDLVQMMTIVANAEQQLRYTSHPRLRFELLLAQLVHLPTACDIGTLIAQLEQWQGAASSLPPAGEQKSTSPSDTSSFGETPPSSRQHPMPAEEKSSAQHSSPPSSPTPSTQEEGNASPFSPPPATSVTVNWQEIITALPKTLETIRILLQELPPPVFEGDKCTITCTDSAAFDALTLKRSQLEKFLSKQCGYLVHVQIVRAEAAAVHTAPAATPPANSTPSQPSHGQELSPIERALVEQFKAQRIPLIQ
ncbi:MAG: DNA polymerase III subunit gamma/tau [Bacteroidota bacterium]|nr:DNA polymerase III subunit gamma/tau [Candidatus Kapabacteria bacterium]MCS7302954.1 DNA polymerase III subunit gamma/tau [Candidatus Kapabacteria bacterium]MCX7937497.1 DNA polymerase III subunit gamma/tau [Chlorobiota bacterium]MDW8075834.1 DNA polymerase III subunit gamma/tau [Bacteroidota bacterium]MDW8271702.1 DNA polymerase III subunit gamma/tau [Bacteroidota bacterium]